MIAPGLILNVLLRLPVCYQDRAEVGYLDRQHVIAQAISSVAETPLEAAALVTILRFESGGCFSVHAGHRKGGPGEGLWQLEPGSHRSRPFSGLSFEATSHAAGEALWLWRHSWHCGPSWQARFTAYAGLSDCRVWTGATPRSKLLGWINHSLTSAAAAQSTVSANTPTQ